MIDHPPSLQGSWQAHLPKDSKIKQQFLTFGPTTFRMTTQMHSGLVIVMVGKYTLKQHLLNYTFLGILPKQICRHQRCTALTPPKPLTENINLTPHTLTRQNIKCQPSNLKCRVIMQKL